MKKFVSILLVAMLIVTSLATVASAAGTVTVGGNTQTAHPGETVTLTFSVNGEFANFGIALSYDQTVLQLVSLGGPIQGNTANGKVAYASAENAGSVSFTATFQVSANAAPGTYYVTPSVLMMKDRDGVSCTPSVGSGAVVIPQPACQHTWGAWETTKEATCTTKGLQTRTCTKCGATETRELAMKPHTTGGWLKDEHNHWHVCSVCNGTFDCAAHTYPGSYTIGQAATAQQDGWKYRDCEVCGYRDIKVIPKDLDDVPETGDITGQFTMGATVVLLMVVASVAFVFKRKTAK